MVQRKVVASKVGIQGEHVIKSDKLFVANMKVSSSNQIIDGKNRVSDMKKKKMKKMKSIKLSDIEALQSSPPPPPPSSSKKQHPNYMKPTSSSHAKKELFPVSLRNTQSSSSDIKNLPRKFSGESKATSDSKKSTKTLTRSSSLSLVRTLTKTTSFKASRVCSRKSPSLNSQSHRATCSSTLKDSKFPEYLMLSSGGTELEGKSVIKVCPYTYCSLNGHHHADFTPLKSFISSRRRHLKMQKRAKIEAMSPERLKVPSKPEKEFDVKPAYDEIGMEDIFIDIYANEKDVESTGSEEMRKTDFLKEVEDQEVKSTIEDDCIAEGEEGVNVVQAIPSITDEEHQTNCSHDHEEMSMGSYCSDEEQMEDIDNDMDDSDSDSDSKSNGINWEEEQFYEFDHEKDADSSSDDESKVESLSESSRDMSVTWLDDILNSYYEDILVDQTIKEAKLEESNYVKEQEQTYDGNCGEENENQVDVVANCSMKKALDEEINDNNIQCQNMSETCKVDETIEDRYSCQEDKDVDNINSNENQIELFDETEESITDVKDILEVVEKDKGKGKKLKSKSCIHDEEEETGEDWKGLIRSKRGNDDNDDDEMKNFNPREPNFLPLVPEEEGEKVDLKHQMMDERKNADEWMIDCALRQVVTKLAPARKKKVALLVEAFESVMPVPKFGSHLRNNSAFAHSRHIQACS